MANKMLIDATHPEETRVVVVRGNRVEEFDFEAANRRPLRGNIYLAKVTRVEPSLQAAFVDYGGNRHGFLAFGEIHPDYYQIPVADRLRLIEEEERAAQAAAEYESRRRQKRQARNADTGEQVSEEAPEGDHAEPQDGEHQDHEAESFAQESVEVASETVVEIAEAEQPAPPSLEEAQQIAEAHDEAHVEAAEGEGNVEEAHAEDAPPPEVVESTGGDAMEEVPERAPRRHRTYKIQEVIKRRQIILVQVVKEERGTKGAALTTYLSLAGRYSVLMPNTARGGGVSRKITDAADRRRLKELVQDLEVPEGMGIILRTAGAARTKTEIKRDFEYLLRLWEQVRERTLNSTAPALVYEEGSLVKRAIRDLYNKDIDEVLVAGDEPYREAKEFMRMLSPSHAKNVKSYRDTLPVFSRYGVEHQLDAMFSPTVQLKSGGYIVINPTEALVSIDVNSDRSTREHNIEDTALRTNLEASEEIARQLRLRDLAGLIVIDFIDMEENRNNRAVERKLKDCLKHDRARIQVGRISHFGLMEMSRQRIRTGVLESSTEICPTCGGTGHMRSVSSVALHLLRALEEQLMKSAANDLIVRTRPDTALYLLNHKRAHLRDLEGRFGVQIMVQSDGTLAGQQYFVVEKGGASRGVPDPAYARRIAESVVTEEDEADDLAAAEEEEFAEEAEADTEAGENAPVAEGASENGDDRNGRRRRRRGRRGGRGRNRDDRPREHSERDHHVAAPMHDGENAEMSGEAEGDEQPGDFSGTHEGAHANEGGEGNGERRPRRRRGRRGGRRNRRDRAPNGDQPHNAEDNGGNFGFDAAQDEPDTTPQPEARPAYPENPGTAPQFNVEQPQPVTAETAPQPVAQPAEQPKRRSTVREAAPVSRFDDTPAPAQVYERADAPLAPENGGTDGGSETPPPSQPRRTGWWRR